jgi:hypothetical protein
VRIMLEDEQGRKIVEGDVPDFRQHPTVVRWGVRLFVYVGSLIAAGGKEQMNYREASCYELHEMSKLRQNQRAV